MKQNLSTTTIAVVLIVVVLVVGLIGWKIMAGKSKDVDPTAVDEDPAMQKMMQESMKQGGGMQTAPPPAPDGS